MSDDVDDALKIGRPMPGQNEFSADEEQQMRRDRSQGLAKLKSAMTPASGSVVTHRLTGGIENLAKGAARARQQRDTQEISDAVPRREED